MSTEKPLTFCLYDLDQPGLILLDERGPTYYNQAGGVFCLQPSAQGYFMPISNVLADIPALDVALTELTRDLPYLSQPVAQRINQLLLKLPSVDRYEVDLDKLAISCEAWIYLKLIPGSEYGSFGNSVPYAAILTWPNSD